MQILMVGLAEKFVGWPERFKAAGAHIVLHVACLDGALERLGSPDEVYLPDGVVCAQSLPTHQSRAAEPPETQSGNWAAVSNRCRELGIPLVLVVSAGGYRLAERFNQVARKTIGKWPAFALIEPVDAAVVADTICTAVRHGKKRSAETAGDGEQETAEVGHGRN